METAKMNLTLGTVEATACLSSGINQDSDFAVFVYESLQRHRKCGFDDLVDEDND